MFDIGPTELLLIVVVAVVVIGPKDLPLALRTAGRWMAKIRKVSGHFRAGLDAMIREAEMAEMEKTWAEQNAKIMADHPGGGPFEMEPTGAWPTPAEPLAATPPVEAPAAEAPAAEPAPAEPAAKEPPGAS